MQTIQGQSLNIDNCYNSSYIRFGQVFLFLCRETDLVVLRLNIWMFTYAMKETEITRTTPLRAYKLLNIEIYMLIYKKGASWNSFFFF